MLIIIGKTASGKDTVVNELVNYGYEKIVTYTSRPMRTGEEENVTYHYISEDEFKSKINDGFFLEYKKYNTECGTWYYGCALNDFNKDTKNKVIILTPDGYRDFLNKVFIPHKSIYLYANNTTIKGRLIKRGDKKDEAERRLNHDNNDFKGIENEVNKIVYNNNDNTISNVLKEILNYMENK